MVYVALLRGVNVGGRNSLPMKDLCALFTQAGCTGVRTYIQSGNVVFQAPPSLAQRCPELIATQIVERFGFRSPVILRTAEELRSIVAANPFLAQGATPESLHVLFLASAPGASQIAALDPDRSPPDSFLVRGREVYLHCPAGYGKSKLTNAYFDSKLATVSTARNWRTAGELLLLTKELQ